jgi:hypothetical protein
MSYEEEASEKIFENLLKNFSKLAEQAEAEIAKLKKTKKKE